MLEEKRTYVHALTHEIINFLNINRDKSIGTRLALERLVAMDLSMNQIMDTPAVGTRHENVLSKAIKEINKPELLGIAHALRRAKKYLAWREDNNNYYQHGDDVGKQYTRCNLHTLLIGPDSCGYYQPDFLLGIFILGPWTFYRDHRHAAPELYLNLSEKSNWRLGTQDWQEYPAGSFVWNEAESVHATQVYDEPFISVFIWLENVMAPCVTFPVDDWTIIESNLHRKANS